MIEEKTEERAEVSRNLAEHLAQKGYPPIYSQGAQIQRTREFVHQIKNAIEKKKPLSDDDIEYFGIYKRITGKIEETFDYRKNEAKEKEESKGKTIEDLKDTLIDWQGKTTQQSLKSIEENSSKAIKEIKEMAREAIKSSQDAAKTVRESLDVMGKYYVDLLDKMTKNSDNVTKNMATTITGITALIIEVLKAFGIHVQTYDELSKKRLKELIKLVEDKELNKEEGKKDFFDKLIDFVPVATEAIKASGRELPPSAQAALDKLSEITNGSKVD